jgi:hypothetical protein
MAHPPHTTSDLTFSQFLKELKSSSKGLKLDFKDINALQPCLIELEAQKDNVSSLKLFLFFIFHCLRSTVQSCLMPILFARIPNVLNVF